MLPVLPKTNPLKKRVYTRADHTAMNKRAWQSTYIREALKEAYGEDTIIFVSTAPHPAPYAPTLRWTGGATVEEVRKMLEPHIVIDGALDTIVFDRQEPVVKSRRVSA